MLTVFVFSQKRPWKNEIYLVDHRIPRPFFWRLLVELTVYVTIEPGRILFFTFLLFVNTLKLFIPLLASPYSPPFFLLGLWYFSHQASPYYHLVLLSGFIFSPWQGMWISVRYFHRPGSGLSSLWEQTQENQSEERPPPFIQLVWQNGLRDNLGASLSWPVKGSTQVVTICLFSPDLVLGTRQRYCFCHQNLIV